MRKIISDLVDKYSQPMNEQEIGKIEDEKIREIKFKYLRLQHNLFLNETDYPDALFVKESDKLAIQENMEIEDYIKRNKELES